MTDVKEFVVDRSQWIRGEGGGPSRLLCKDGRRCCLGFFGEACGVSPKGMLDVLLPVARVISWPPWMFEPQRGAGEARAYLADVNDDEDMSASKRERLLIEAFAERGVTVRFVDGPEAP